MSGIFEGVHNWDQGLAGGGLADSAAQVVKSIKDGDWLTGGANIAVASLDLLGIVSSPIKALGTSSAGWIIEHLWFLDSFLDHTVGDPGAVQAAAETFMATARDLDTIAGRQFKAFKTEVPYYRGGHTESSSEFEKNVGPRGDQLQALSLQCLGIGNSLSLAAMLVASCRGMIREMLADFAWWTLTRVYLATSAAPASFGASLVAAVAEIVLKASALASRLTSKLADVLGSLGRLAALLRKLAGVFDSPVSRAVAVGMLKNSVPAAAKHADDAVSPTSAEREAGKDDVVIEAQGPYVNEPPSRERPPAAQEPPPPSFYPPSDQPVPPAKPKQGPGLQDARWSTSGTLDDA